MYDFITITGGRKARSYLVSKIQTKLKKICQSTHYKCIQQHITVHLVGRTRSELISGLTINDLCYCCGASCTTCICVEFYSYVLGEQAEMYDIHFVQL